MATLRIMGDDLAPEEITKLLGCPSTKSQAKGEVIRGKNTHRERIANTGMWQLTASDREPEDLNGQVLDLLSKLTPDLIVWSAIRQRFKIDLFCGLFMKESNEGAVISPETLRFLGERGIELSLDIYAPTKEVEEEEPHPCALTPTDPVK